VQEHYDWSAVAGSLADAIEAIAARKPIGDARSEPVRTHSSTVHRSEPSMVNQSEI